MHAFVCVYRCMHMLEGVVVCSHDGRCHGMVHMMCDGRCHGMVPRRHEEAGLDMSVAAFEHFGSLATGMYFRQWDSLPEAARRQAAWQYIGVEDLVPRASASLHSIGVDEGENLMLWEQGLLRAVKRSEKFYDYITEHSRQRRHMRRALVKWWAATQRIQDNNTAVHSGAALVHDLHRTHWFMIYTEPTGS